MGINFWLDHYKRAKKDVEQLYAQLYVKTMIGEIRWIKPSKPLSLSLTWTDTDFNVSDVVISGLGIIHPISGMLWNEDLENNVVLSKGNKIVYSLRNVTVEDKWTLADFLPENEDE